MKLLLLKSGRYDEFFSFNKTIYSERNKIKARFQYQVINNPCLEDKSSPNYILACNDSDRIVGQIGLSPFQYHYNNRLEQGYYGFDFFVKEEYRGMAGAALAFRTFKNFRPFFTIGATEVSDKLWLSLKARIIGNLDYFIWVRSPFIPINMLRNILFKGQSLKVSFPEILNCGNFTFKICTSPPTHWKDSSWRGNTLQFARSHDFIKWRFFENERPYYFYMLDSPGLGTYFVCRTIMKRSLKILMIVDYRVSDEDSDGFEGILNAAKKLARAGKHDIIFTVSSHSYFDKILKKERFRHLKMKTSHHILAASDLAINEDSINKRECVYATYTDYDKEFEV